MTKFKLSYWISNQGDGSVALRIADSEDAAAKDEEESNGDECWGESSVGSLDFVIKNGKICLVDNEWDGKAKKWNVVYQPLEVVQST